MLDYFGRRVGHGVRSRESVTVERFAHQREATPLEHRVDRAVRIRERLLETRASGAPLVDSTIVERGADTDREPRLRLSLEIAFAVVIERAERRDLHPAGIE